MKLKDLLPENQERQEEYRWGKYGEGYDDAIASKRSRGKTMSGNDKHNYIHGYKDGLEDRKKRVNESDDGTENRWIGGIVRWKRSVIAQHGPDIVFRNMSRPGTNQAKSVIARNENGDIVGMYERHNKMGIVLHPSR